MTARFKVRPLPLTVLGALVACLTFVAEGHAQAKKGPPKKPAQEVVAQQKKLAEVEQLVNAYILLAEANHDYDGHRVKAMKHIQDAVGLLDKEVMAKGTPAQKAQAAMEERMGAAAKKAAGAAPPLGENQKKSDLQVAAALDLLVKVHAAMNTDKLKPAQGHVGKAIAEAKTALKIR